MVQVYVSHVITGIILTLVIRNVHLVLGHYKDVRHVRIYQHAYNVAKGTILTQPHLNVPYALHNVQPATLLVAVSHVHWDIISPLTHVFYVKRTSKVVIYVLILIIVHNALTDTISIQRIKNVNSVEMHS